MNIDRNEKCGICQFPRHAHWGVPALVAGRCSGFQPDLPPGRSDKIAEIIDAAKAEAAKMSTAAERAATYDVALIRIREMLV